MTNQEYWAKRILEGQKQADKISDYATKKQRDYYKKSYKKIIKYLNSLLVDIELGNEVTRSELYQANKYIILMEQIEKEAGLIGSKQIKDFETAINKAYRVKITSKPIKDNKFNLINKYQKEQALNLYWSGISFKQRVGINANKFAGRVKDKVTESIILGKSPDMIKKQLMREFNVAYNVADRLIRTETAHAFTQASVNQYKDEGVQQVKILTIDDAPNAKAKAKVQSGNGACDYCLEKRKEGAMNINTAELPPYHPNCRCCIIPVVDKEIIKHKL